MSVVGPRPLHPEVSAELARRIPFYEQRYALKPGLTGWSQINADPKNPLDALCALEYDLYYLKHLSLALDAYILLHRLRHLFSFAS
jgi:lipopolysaccharide/colanic/teichoic acid biosynthesis glycosyltransferase